MFFLSSQVYLGTFEISYKWACFFPRVFAMFTGTTQTLAEVR